MTETTTKINNRRALALLNDLIDAGVATPQFIVPIPASLPRHVRRGIVVVTDETEKMEIAGLPCIVKSENEKESRVYVLVNEKPQGPYTLNPSEVI